MDLLHAAAHNNDPQMASVLIEQGVDVNRPDHDGWTALQCAAGEGHVEVAGVLISHGARLNVKGVHGWTPLHLAAINGQEKMVSFLTRKGAVDAADKGGMTALDVAEQLGSLEAADVLRSYGASHK